MGPEQVKGNIVTPPRDLERLVTQKEPRLPQGIRKYITRLKAEGQWEKAMEVAREAKEQKFKIREGISEVDLLHLTIRQILETDDPTTQAEQEVRAIWLLYATGVIGSKEKTDELLATLDSKSPDLKAFLEGRLSDIRDELQPLLPKLRKLGGR